MSIPIPGLLLPEVTRLYELCRSKVETKTLVQADLSALITAHLHQYAKAIAFTCEEFNKRQVDLGGTDLGPWTPTFTITINLP